MNRQQLTLRLAAGAVPLAESLLALAGTEVVELSDAGDEPVLEPAPETAPLWPDVRLRALFPPSADLAPLIALLHERCAASDVAVSVLTPAAWEGAVRQAIKARPLGRRAWLAPAEDDDAPADRICIRLHMGLAFGTGEHPTTALCLDWLEANVTTDLTVLDFGCGSGVLAIAALALGARYAWAVDNDPQALEATRANAALNGVSERLFVSTPEALPDVTADVLVANILAGPLVALAPEFATRTHAGGALVLSGILESQAARVRAAYAPCFDSFEITTRDGWACLAAKRRALG